MRAPSARYDAGVWSAAQPALRRQFIVRAHELVAAGHARLDGASLAGEEETTITGRLCEAINRYLRDAHAPDWSQSFAIHEDPPVDDSRKTGKRRDRVDIEIECTIRPRPVFSFEAKPLRDGHSVADYVGANGLGCLCSGKYASVFDFAGMLGYVCAPARSQWIEKIQRKLEGERAAHGLAPAGPVWAVDRVAEGLGDSRRSVHERRDLGPIHIYHSFLVCHGAPGVPAG